jgi:hypothetical protein
MEDASQGTPDEIEGHFQYLSGKRRHQKMRLNAIDSNRVASLHLNRDVNRHECFVYESARTALCFLALNCSALSLYLDVPIELIEGRSMPTFDYTVDGIDQSNTQHELTPNEVLSNAKIDPNTNYLVEIIGREKKSYQGSTAPIHMHEHMTFISVSTNPTPVSR